MADRKKPRPLDAVLADIEEAAEAARELIGRGKDAWEDVGRLSGPLW